jgi:hypothetical protein
MSNLFSSPRLDGWEARLFKVLGDARRKPYALGEHDCFSLACQVVHALTGVDRWPEFKGYTTKREALMLIAERGSTFELAFDWFFGERIEKNYARRGDIAAIQTPDGEKHLAVIMGHVVSGLAPEGLILLPLKATLCCWRVG